MSRISRYQDCFSRFIKNKSLANNLTESSKNKVHNLSAQSEHIPSIVFLTIINVIGIKNKTTYHGYYMASGIEFMELIAKLTDNVEYDSDLVIELIGLLNVCLSQNIELIQQYFDNSIVNKIFHKCIILLNSKVSKISLNYDLPCENEIGNSDILKINLPNINKENIKNKLLTLKQVKRNSLMNFVIDKYGSVCQLALTLAWLLSGGSGENKVINKLEKMGENLAYILKISYDFVNLEHDLLNSTKYSRNLIINIGFQNSFELFIQNKHKFISGCLSLDIYTNTMKELVDLMESNIDNIIDKASPDVPSNY